MVRFVGWLLSLLVAAAISLALQSPLPGGVFALPLGACELWAYGDQQAAAIACPGHDLIRVWPLPVMSPWFEDLPQPDPGLRAERHNYARA